MDIKEYYEGESDKPINEYNDIDDDEVLIPSNTNEEDLFVDEKMEGIVESRKKKRLKMYDPRVDHDTLKFKVIICYRIENGKNTSS